MGPEGKGVETSRLPELKCEGRGQAGEGANQGAGVREEGQGGGRQRCWALAPLGTENGGRGEGGREGRGGGWGVVERGMAAEGKGVEPSRLPELIWQGEGQAGEGEIGGWGKRMGHGVGRQRS